MTDYVLSFMFYGSFVVKVKKLFLDLDYSKCFVLILCFLPLQSCFGVGNNSHSKHIGTSSLSNKVNCQEF